MTQICVDKLLVFNLLLLVSVVACEMKEIFTFTAHERGKVEICCPYQSKYKEHKKYLCRDECQRLYKDKVVESGSAAKDERFSLTDNKTAHVFTVTITDLRIEDRGQYWCGIETGFSKLDDFTQIHLKIKHVTSERASPKPTTSSSCYSKPTTANTASNRPDVTSSSSSPSVLLLFSSSADAVSPKPQPDFTSIIMLSVMGMLLGFGFLLFIFLGCRQKKEAVRLRGVIHVLAKNLPTKEA
ncbi:hypothetical protein Q8A67_005299 [Cirrhinus molitorella]|uniref:Immunoglobulin V-set domain-containing protein n=1 Tax=Cirrhinus molitorella TaxID=172907 RepID=A0AA88QC25_9TELE|nr:hypothetical protein Q8A67_005299 [Cirrhinus molitorella]